jgi:hypothetical protein
MLADRHDLGGAAADDRLGSVDDARDAKGATAHDQHRATRIPAARRGARGPHVDDTRFGPDDRRGHDPRRRPLSRERARQTEAREGYRGAGRRLRTVIEREDAGHTARESAVPDVVGGLSRHVGGMPLARDGGDGLAVDANLFDPTFQAVRAREHHVGSDERPRAVPHPGDCGEERPTELEPANDCHAGGPQVESSQSWLTHAELPTVLVLRYASKCEAAVEPVYVTWVVGIEREGLERVQEA